MIQFTRLQPPPIGATVILVGVTAFGCASPPDRPHTGALSITLENDIFTGSDNNYSNGAGVSWATNEAGTYDESSFIRNWIDTWSSLPFVGDEQQRNYASWTFGQEIFTPDDIQTPTPPLDDQPYAGVLFLDNTIISRSERWGHAWNLRLGVVGPSSLAGDTQEQAHKIFGADEPLGWDAQLPDGPVINVDYTIGCAWLGGDLNETASWRVVPLGTVGIGTYFTGLGALAYGEIGWNLADALGGAALRQGLSTTPVIGAGPQDSWSFSFFFGLGGFAAAHYLPLDGNLFRDSRSVDSEPFIGTVSGGLSLRYGHFVLGLGQSYFTRSFETERNRPEFGTLALSVYF